MNHDAPKAKDLMSEPKEKNNEETTATDVVF